jgi:hypothetical protein
VIIPDQSQVAEDKKVYLFKKHLEEKRTEKDNWKFFVHCLQTYWTTLFDQHEKIVIKDQKT